MNLSFEHESINDLLSKLEKMDNEENDMMNSSDLKFSNDSTNSNGSDDKLICPNLNISENMNLKTIYSIISQQHPPEYRGFYLMINFMIMTKHDVPINLRNTCIQNEFGHTLSLYYLIIMKDMIMRMISVGKINEVFPKWMFHNPELRDRSGWTIAMYWIKLFGCDVPLWMRHDPKLKNNDGKTVKDLFIESQKKLNSSVSNESSISNESNVKSDELNNSGELNKLNKLNSNISDESNEFIEVPNWMT